jgi:hypothetical protein
MSTQMLLGKLIELEESVRVNKVAILKILEDKSLGEGDKNELIKSITIPLIINNRALVNDIESIYTKGTS